MPVATESALKQSLPVRQLGPVLLLGAIVAVFWTQLSAKLCTDWSTNLQYEFGIFVPFFVLFLAARRWTDRPAERPPGSTWPIALCSGLLLLFLLPIRLVQEANPDWRPLNWVHAGLVVALTLLAFFYVGGPRWLWHFAFPCCLIFCALPWPLQIEQSVIQSMGRAVAAVTTELLNLVGVPALYDGNVIQVATGSVGIADACTGVRSLAGTLMASVFFGEFYRLGWVRRLILVGSGVLIAFVLNLVRTSLLGWIAANQGIEAISKWHDQTGLLIFFIAFGILWFTGETLSTHCPLSSRQSAPPLSCKSVRFPVLIGIAAWLLLVEGTTEAWYRIRERDLPYFMSWSPAWPAENYSFKFVEIPDEARAILRFSEGRSAVLEEPGSPRWQIFSFRWEPGRTSSQLAVLHRPDICLPAAGLKLVSRAPRASVQVQSMKIPFESYVFDSAGTPLYVFRTLSEDRRPPGATSGFDQSLSGRLRSAWYGRRNLGQKLLQVGILGPANEQLALADLQARLPRFVSVSN